MEHWTTSPVDTSERFIEVDIELWRLKKHSLANEFETEGFVVDFGGMFVEKILFYFAGDQSWGSRHRRPLKCRNWGADWLLLGEVCDLPIPCATT